MKSEYSDARCFIIVLMRIPARWTWVPLAVTVAGVIYLSMVKAADRSVVTRGGNIVHEPPRPFVPPPAPARRQPLVPDPSDAAPAPVRPAPPALPPIALPTYRRP